MHALHHLALSVEFLQRGSPRRQSLLGPPGRSGAAVNVDHRMDLSLWRLTGSRTVLGQPQAVGLGQGVQQQRQGLVALAERREGGQRDTGAVHERQVQGLGARRDSGEGTKGEPTTGIGRAEEITAVLRDVEFARTMCGMRAAIVLHYLLIAAGRKIEFSSQ